MQWSQLTSSRMGPEIRHIHHKFSLGLQGQHLRAPVWHALLGLCAVTDLRLTWPAFPECPL